MAGGGLRLQRTGRAAADVRAWQPTRQLRLEFRRGNCLHRCLTSPCATERPVMHLPDHLLLFWEFPSDSLIQFQSFSEHLTPRPRTNWRTVVAPQRRAALFPSSEFNLNHCSRNTTAVDGDAGPPLLHTRNDTSPLLNFGQRSTCHNYRHRLRGNSAPPPDPRTGNLKRVDFWRHEREVSTNSNTFPDSCALPVISISRRMRDSN
jgi:hypothetical protein